jgi:exonuclease SbcC
MLIRSLELENIKSYGPRSIEIPFRPGINLICGRNGSGKSTILESIGFALFGSLDYKQSQLCREGEKSGKIVLSFESRLDERTYEVIRGVGKSSLKIYDPTSKSWLVRARKDSEEWLSEHLGIEMSYAKELFSNVVGVSQGKMMGSFLQSARVRKPLFNPLLRVEEYETAWSKLRDTTRYLTNQLAEANQVVARLEGRLERLPEVEEQVERLQAKLLSERAALTQAKEQLVRLEDEVRMLKEKEEEVQRLTQQVAEIKRDLKNLMQQMKVAEKELKKAEDAATVVAQSRDGYAAYQEAQTERNELEARRKERDRHAKALQSTEKKLARVVTTLTHLVKDLEEVSKAEAKVLELVPLVEQQVELEEQVRQAQQQVQQRKQTLQRAKEEAKQLAKLVKSLAKIEAQLVKRAKIEQECTIIAETQANLATELNDLDDQLSSRSEEQTELDGELRRAQQDKRDWENAQERLTSEEGTLKRYQRTLSDVKKQLEERERLQQALQSAEEAIITEQTKESTAKTQQKHLRQQLQTLEERLVMLQGSDTADCPVCKRELSEHLAHELEQEFEREQDSLQRQQKEAKKDEQAALKKLRVLKRQQKRQQQALNKLPTAGRVKELRQSIKEQEITVKAWQARVVALAEAADEVQGLHHALQQLNEELATLNDQDAMLIEEREELDKERHKRGSQLSRLPQASRADELSNEIKEAQAQKERFEKEAKELANVPLQLEEAKAALAQLASPRTKQAKQQAIASKRPKLEREQVRCEKQQAKLLLQQEAQEATFALFASLESEFESNKATLAANKSAYHQYMAHQKIAQSLPARQQSLSTLDEAHTAQSDKRDKLVEKERQAQQNYDIMRHQQAKKAFLQTNNQIITLQTQLKGAQSQLEDAESERAALQKQQKALKAAEAEVTRWTQLSDAFRFVRDGIRQAGPAVVQRRVRLISHHADQLFQDIIEDPSYALNWDENYAITIRCRGEERDFQQLSGGEQMGAAIAVRLALLMQMSPVRMLFLDEPTTNLDERRRDKLTDRITKLEGLQQIFVITHDDSFERETHHVLRVRKENGMSIVKVG